MSREGLSRWHANRIDKISTIDYATLVLAHPLSPDKSKRLIRDVIQKGGVIWGRHVLEDKFPKEKLNTVDCINVMRGGTVDPPEFENGEWRYRVWTSKITVVVSLVDNSRLRVVTAWRTGR